MKRYNNLFDKIVTLDNLYLADKRARKQKQHRPEIINFDKNREKLLLNL
jgi:RNA-directed DNA polymerase